MALGEVTPTGLSRSLPALQTLHFPPGTCLPPGALPPVCSRLDTICSLMTPGPVSLLSSSPRDWSHIPDITQRPCSVPTSASPGSSLLTPPANPSPGAVSFTSKYIPDPPCSAALPPPGPHLLAWAPAHSPVFSRYPAFSGLSLPACRMDWSCVRVS